MENLLSGNVNLAMLACLLIALSITIALLLKLHKLKELKSTIAYLKQSLEELDEQAKLIVRTDLELNKTQEELDKRISGLYALQRISQELSKTLQQSEIFSRIRSEDISDLGFHKALIFMEDKGLSLKYQTGYLNNEVTGIKTKMESENFYELFKAKNITFSSVSASLKFGKDISAIFGPNSFVISPLVKKDGACGFLYLASDAIQAPLTAGDEELAAILATHLAQALDNAELFEEAYMQHQLLEKKVLARTQELSSALEQLNNASKRKTDFVSAVSHELRTPLTSIKGYAAILFAGKLGEIPKEVKERLEKINLHSDELVHMVNDLLDIARIESGRIEMKFEPLNISAITENVLDMLSPQLKEKSITAKLDIPAQAVNVLADRTQISRVFINLLSNAIKFVPEKSGEIRIQASADGEFVQVNISDNGIGMSPNDAKRIFEEFYRVDNPINQKVKGTGLGLTLVKNIVQAHKGKIWVESRINHGSTFSFTLPKITLPVWGGFGTRPCV